MRLRRREIEPISARDIRYNLRTFATTINWPAANELTQQHIELWKERSRLSKSTTRSRLSQITGLCQWLVSIGVVRTDPTVGVKPPRQPRILPRSLQAEHVAALLSVVPDTRGRLIVLLMVQEGLRRGEVATLEVGDVSLDQASIFVRGKGSHERVVALTDETREALLAYLREAPTSAGPLIRAQERRRDGTASRWQAGAGITPNYVGLLVSGWMYDAGIKTRPFDGRSAHALRHTSATDMVLGGAPLPAVQAALGHRSLATTGRYVLATAEGVREAMGGRRYGVSVAKAPARAGGVERALRRPRR